MLNEFFFSQPASVSNLGALGQVTSDSSNTFTACELTAEDGYGYQYLAPQPNPADRVYGIAFSPSGKACAIAMRDSPRVKVWRWSIPYALGFGTPYADPVEPATGTGEKVVWSPSGKALVLIRDDVTVDIWAWSDTTGFGSKFTSPSPGGDILDVAFSPSGDAISMVTNSDRYIYTYAWSDLTGVGALYEKPSSTPSGTGIGVAFSPSGNSLAVLHANGNGIRVYPWSSASGYGATPFYPGFGYGGTGNEVRFSPDGTVIAIAHSSGDYVTAFPWSDSTGFGAKYARPNLRPSVSANCLAFNPEGSLLVVGTDAATISGSNRNTIAYPWDNVSGFGAGYTTPWSRTGPMTGLDFSPV